MKRIVKVISAGVTAIVILSLLLCMYSVIPVHVENEKGNTDYVWTADSTWVKMTEGTAWGRFDENGYNNLEVVENPDIIVLGSSHMEATNVMQDENAAYLLGEKLKGEYTVYNMGISDHDFYKTCQYLRKSIEQFETPPKVAIIETSTVCITGAMVKQIKKASIEHRVSYSTGLVASLQKVPFFRMLYKQKNEGLLDVFAENDFQQETIYNVETDEAVLNKLEDSGSAVADSGERGSNLNKRSYKLFFKYISKIEKETGTQIIIVYHPEETINEDGSISFETGRDAKLFNVYARKYKIGFVNMTSDFISMYENEHHVPHGFITGELGTGHLNKYGHKAIADALYEKIRRMEAAGRL